jgi:microcystin-dependent protein
MTTPGSQLLRRDFLGRLLVLLGGAALFGRAKRVAAAPQWTEPYIGEIMICSFAFAPKGWAMCNGQLLSISQNQALFSLLGTTYGGNGTTNFALPDLRGRVPIHFGQGPGLSNRALGEVGGALSHTIAIAEMPAHAHVARCASGNGTSAGPPGMVPAGNPAGIPQWRATADTTLAAGAISTVGNGQPHENTSPTLALNYVIALVGTFPPSN